MTVISIPTNILKAVAVAMGGKPRFVGGTDFGFLLVDTSGILIASDGRVTHVGRIKDIEARTTGQDIQDSIRIPKTVVRAACRDNDSTSTDLACNNGNWSLGGHAFDPIEGRMRPMRIAHGVNKLDTHSNGMGVYTHFDLKKAFDGIRHLGSEVHLCFVDGMPHTFTAVGFEDCFMATMQYQELPTVAPGFAVLGVWR